MVSMAGREQRGVGGRTESSLEVTFFYNVGLCLKGGAWPMERGGSGPDIWRFCFTR